MSVLYVSTHKRISVFILIELVPHRQRDPSRIISLSRTVPLNDLVGHAERDHPDECQRLADMSFEEVNKLLRLITKNTDEDTNNPDESGASNGSDEAGRSPPVKKSRMSLDKRLALNGSSNVIDIDVRSLRSAFLPHHVFQNKVSRLVVRYSTDPDF